MVEAVDASNNVVSGYRGTLHFSTTDSGALALLPADYTFTAADNGIHVFPGGAVLVTAGSQQLTVTDVSGGVPGGFTSSATVSVGAASAVHNLQLHVAPTLIGGTSMNATVWAKDVYGNTVSNYVGTVHFAKTDTGTGSAVPADYTFTSADDGMHVFTNGVTLVTYGNQTVTASASGVLRAGVTVSVTEAVSYFVVTAPTSVVAGNLFNVTITAMTSAGNTATGYSGTVAFSSTNNDFYGYDSFNAADIGVVVYSDVYLTNALVDTLTVTDPLNNDATGSATVTGLAGPYDHLLLTGPAGAVMPRPSGSLGP